MQADSRRAYSIQSRLMFACTASLVLATLGATATLYFRFYARLEARCRPVLESLAAKVMAPYERRGGAVESASPEAVAATLCAEYLSLEFRVFDDAGALVLATPGWRDEPKPSVSSEDAGRGVEMVQLGNDALRHYAATRSWSIAGKPWLVQVAVAVEDVENALAGAELDLLFLLIPLLAFGAAGGWLLARMALRPALAMAHTAQEISARNLKTRIETRGTGDELDQLANALNGMLERLRESFARIETFASDLAHELRTPLTLLTSETEAVLLADAPKDQMRELLARHAEVYRSLRTMLNDLLDLLRTGTAGEPFLAERISLCPLVADVVDSFQPLAEDRGIRLELEDSGPELLVKGKSTALRRVLFNLFDNALAYTTKGGEVRVIVGGSDHSAVIRVQDTGEGIAPDDLPFVFERFYRGRGDRAEARRGFGLGLSIARQIVQQHGGTLEIQSAVGHGTTASVMLPLAGADTPSPGGNAS